MSKSGRMPASLDLIPDQRRGRLISSHDLSCVAPSIRKEGKMLARNMTAIASAILLASPAFADGEFVSAKIMISDLDLSSKSGQARFDRRVRHATRQVCGSESFRDLRFRDSFIDCSAEVRTQASQKLELARSSRGSTEIQVAARSPAK